MSEPANVASLEQENKELRTFIKNVRGFLDTPVMRRRFASDWLYDDIIMSLRALPPDIEDCIVCVGTVPLDASEDVERMAEEIYNEMRKDSPEGQKYPWVPGGNSNMQEEARSRARARLNVA